VAKAKAADAVIFGAVGGPKWDKVPYDARPEAGLLRLRKDLALYANLRPAVTYPALADASSLKRELVEGLDILILRELTGGVYFGEPKTITENTLRHGFAPGLGTVLFPDDLELDLPADQSATEWAVYGELGIDLTRKWNLKLGGRYFESGDAGAFVAELSVPLPLILRRGLVLFLEGTIVGIRI